MRIALVVAIAGLTLAVWGEWEYSSALRWIPLDQQPIPTSNSAATFDFESASGIFGIDIELPMSEQEKSATGGLAMNSSVPCNLVVDLYAGKDRLSDLSVNTLHQDGIIGYSKMDCFEGGKITIPRRGHYSLKVQNLANDSNMVSGKLSIIREENSENAAVLAGILNLCIWAFGGMIGLIGIGFVINCWRKGRRPVSNGA